MRNVSFNIGLLVSVCAALLAFGTMFTAFTDSGSYSCTPDFETLPTEDIGVWGMFQKLPGGVVFSFMVIVGLSMTAGWLAIAIALRYRLARQQSREFENHFGEALHLGRVQDLVRLSRRYPRSPLAVVIGASLNGRDPGAISEFRPSTHGRQRAIIAVTENLKKGLWVLPAIASCLPLVSLFASYSELNSYAYTSGVVHPLTLLDAKLILGAMWSLPWCVAVSLPTIWMHKYLYSRFESLKIEVDRLSLALLDQLRSSSLRTRQETRRVDRATTSELIAPRAEGRAWPSAGLIALNL